MIRPALLLAALLLAAPAAGQDAPASGPVGDAPSATAHPNTPEAVAALAVAACVVDAPGAKPDTAAIEAAGLALDDSTHTTASYYSDLATLDLAGGPDTYACELRLAPQDEAGLAALAQALAAAIGARHEIVGGDTLPNGQSWRILPSEGVVTDIALTDDGPATLITGTTTRGEPAPADIRGEPAPASDRGDTAPATTRGDTAPAPSE